MEYQITSQPNWHTVVRFTIAAEQIQPELQSKYEEYQKHARVEGFRKGKVPEALLKKMFGKSIEAEVFDKWVKEASRTLFTEHSFDLLNPPEVKEMHYDEESGLRFELHFDVRPVFDIVGFEGMPVEKEIYEVTEEDVERMMENIRDRHAMVFTVEGEAQPNHYLVVDLQELDVTGVPIVGEKIEQQVIWLREDDRELTPQLLHVKAGEQRRIVLKSEDQGLAENRSERNREKYFQVLVREVKERRVPELDDEFAKDVGPYQSLAELRADVEKRMKEEAQRATEEHFREALEDELIKRLPFQVPPTYLERYIDLFIKDLRKRNKGNIDEGAVRSSARPFAIRNLKWMLIRERMLEQFNLRVSDEQLQQTLQEFEKQGEEGRAEVEKIKKDQQLREHLRDHLEDERIYTFLATRAKVTEVKKSWQDKARHSHQSSEEEE